MEVCKYYFFYHLSIELSRINWLSSVASPAVRLTALPQSGLRTEPSGSFNNAVEKQANQAYGVSEVTCSIRILELQALVNRHGKEESCQSKVTVLSFSSW